MDTTVCFRTNRGGLVMIAFLSVRLFGFRLTLHPWRTLRMLISRFLNAGQQCVSIPLGRYYLEFSAVGEHPTMWSLSTNTGVFPTTNSQLGSQQSLDWEKGGS